MDPITSYGTHQVSRYGAADKYDFDNPAKWHTEPSVPLLDEHEMTNEQGKPMAFVDKTILEQIANNNNKRVRETGDPATLILGHTSDDPRAPEKPAKGFVVNYHVKPFRRDPESGQVVYAIHGDYKIRPQNKHLIEEYPRRSVELWWNKKELDPIAMLGGTSPERDLSVVIRNARFNHISVEKVRVDPTTHQPVLYSDPDVIKFSRRGQYTVERYSIDDVMSRRRFNCVPNQGKTMSHSNGKQPSAFQYEAGLDDDDDMGDGGDGFGGGGSPPNDFDGGDEAMDPEAPDSAETDPVLSKLLQSKQWKDITSKLNMIMEVIGGGEGGGEGDMGGPPPGPPGMGNDMPPPGGAGGPPPGMPPGAGPGGPPGGDEDLEEEARSQHGAAPVQFNSTGMPGPMNTNIPSVGGRKGKVPMSRHTQPQRGRTPDASSDVVIRLKRAEATVRTLQEELAAKEADSAIKELIAEGVIFGRTPEEDLSAQKETLAFLTYSRMRDKADFDYEVNVIRTRYQRKKPDPVNPAFPGVARFARPQIGEPESPDDFEPETPQEACDLADLTGVRKMSRADAVSMIRKRRNS